MNWDALGAVAELVAAGGVIASLLYLAAQVQTSNRASAVQAKLESTRLLNDFMDLLIQRPECNQLMLKGRNGIDALSPDEYQQYSNLILAATRARLRSDLGRRSGDVFAGHRPSRHRTPRF